VDELAEIPLTETTNFILLSLLLKMIKTRKRLGGLIGCLAVLTCSACGSFRLQAADAPREVVFSNPVEEIQGGVRLAPLESLWDGYGEAIDVRGDVLVIGASEWNPCGHGSAYVYHSSGGAWQEEAQLTPSDREGFVQQARRFEGQRFGSSVAVGEGIIAIGAPGNASPIAGVYTGAVYLYEYDGRNWVETAIITPDRPNLDTAERAVDPSICSRLRPRSFGALVALEGDTLAVGGDSATDSVYIYQRDPNGWKEQARLPIPGSPGRDLYMVSMALYGDTLSLSAFYVPPQTGLPQFMTGYVTVYVFERAGHAWEESFRFTPEGEDLDLLFLPEANVGAAVGLGGGAGEANLLAIGLPGFPDWTGELDVGLVGVNPDPVEYPDSHRKSGAVYIFERGENGRWNPQATLRPAGWEDPPGPGSLFAGVPSPTDGEQGVFDDAAYLASLVFPGDVFSKNPEISFFGATVDLDGDQLAVTAGFANATYLFERLGQDWVYRFSITPTPDGEMWEDYAQVVALSGGTLLLGTPGEFGNSAYVFNLNP
jgi:hypothetical protein